MSASRRLGAVEIRRLLDEAGIVPSRALGQNFVIDPNTVERIARLSSVGPDDAVVEIGAGLGSLTLALASTGARVTAVELDHRLAEVLRDVVPENVRVVEQDASEVDFGALFSGADAPGSDGVTLVANLPYNVATPLVLRILEDVPVISRLLVMVQREVGERFSAIPRTKAYGAVSVRIAYFASARVVGFVSPEVFFPRPRVTSALVELKRRATPVVEPQIATYAEIATIVRAGFAHRRKMLRRSLDGLVSDDVFLAAGIAPTDRAEDLDIRAWGKLAACRRSIESSRTRN